MEETKDFKEKTEVNNAEKEQNTEKEKTTVKNSKKVKTKNKENTKRGKHKAKATIGDIVFRTLILVIIFFIVLLAYTFYIKGSIY